MGSVVAHRMMLEATLRGLTKWAPPGPICRQNACMMDLENLKNHKNYVIDAILLQARWSSQQAMHSINRKHGEEQQPTNPMYVCIALKGSNGHGFYWQDNSLKRANSSPVG